MHYSDTWKAIVMSFASKKKVVFVEYKPKSMGNYVKYTVRRLFTVEGNTGKIRVFGSLITCYLWAHDKWLIFEIGGKRLAAVKSFSDMPGNYDYIWMHAENGDVRKGHLVVNYTFRNKCKYGQCLCVCILDYRVEFGKLSVANPRKVYHVHGRTLKDSLWRIASAINPHNKDIYITIRHSNLKVSIKQCSKKSDYVEMSEIKLTLKCSMLGRLVFDRVDSRLLFFVEKYGIVVLPLDPCKDYAASDYKVLLRLKDWTIPIVNQLGYLILKDYELKTPLRVYRIARGYTF
jgi:hypothetical protein